MWRHVMCAWFWANLVASYPEVLAEIARATTNKTTKQDSKAVVEFTFNVLSYCAQRMESADTCAWVQLWRLITRTSQKQEVTRASCDSSCWRRQKWVLSLNSIRRLRKPAFFEMNTDLVSQGCFLTSPCDRYCYVSTLARKLLPRRRNLVFAM